MGGRSAAGTGSGAPPTSNRERHSVRARLLDWLLRVLVRPLLRGATDLIAVRKNMQRFDWRAPFRPGCCELVDGVPVRFVGETGRLRVVLYLHGGGFFMAATQSQLAFLERLCAETGASGVLPAYRLAPEHPFPSGLDDCTRVYAALLARGIPGHSITIAGESAGGTLALALLMRLRDRGLPLPGCAVLISPGTDLRGIGEHPSYVDNAARDALVPPESLPLIIEAYAAGQDLSSPEISPLYGDFTGLPPLHFVASRDEVLRDDSVLAASKAHAAGVLVELHLWGDLMHAFPMFHRLPEARTARAEIARFVNANCAAMPVSGERFS